MLTFFTTAKPFLGHCAIIQRNALRSWTLVHPDAEVILFGDDEGAAEAARELGIRHEPYVLRSECGTKRLDYLFARAQEIARHDVLCYINCDIVLLEDFGPALERVKAAHSQFLMVGRRWDTGVAEAIDFSSPHWPRAIWERARAANNRRPPNWIDYFAFSRGVYHEGLRPFVVGRVYWDNWLIWRAAAAGAIVVDASDAVLAVHQNHDYGYHLQGKEGVWNDAESQRNFELAGGHKHLRAIDSAQLRLTAGGLAENPWHRLAYWRGTAKRLATKSVWTSLQSNFWHPFLNWTRPIRHRAGLRQERLVPAFLRHRPRRYWLDE